MRFAPDRPMRLAPATVGDYRELARRKLPRQLFGVGVGRRGAGRPGSGMSSQ